MAHINHVIEKRMVRSLHDWSRYCPRRKRMNEEQEETPVTTITHHEMTPSARAQHLLHPALRSLVEALSSGRLDSVIQLVERLAEEVRQHPIILTECHPSFLHCAAELGRCLAPQVRREPTGGPLVRKRLEVTARCAARVPFLSPWGSLPRQTPYQR